MVEEGWGGVVSTFFNDLRTAVVNFLGQLRRGKLKGKAYGMWNKTGIRVGWDLLRSEEWNKVVKYLFALVQFKAEVVFIGIRSPSAPKFDGKFGRGIGESGQGGRDAGAETVSGDGIIGTKDVQGC